MEQTLLFIKIRSTILSASGSNVFIDGLYCRALSGNMQIYNNIIGDLRAPLANNDRALTGIETNDAGTLQLSFNSVYLNALSSGLNFGTASIYATNNSVLTLKNNIFANKSVANGTGITAAYRRSTTNLSNYSVASNNNLFYAGMPAFNHAVYYDGSLSYMLLRAFQGLLINRDAASVTEDPPFASTVSSNANFLTINTTLSTQIESGAVPVPGITDDFMANVRNVTTPDIGDVEGNYLAFTSCTNAPVLNSISASATPLCPNATNLLVLPITSTVTGLSYQ